MITKEELLQKGLSEETANEIIAAFESKEDPDNPLQLLEKALNEGSNTEVKELSKAKSNKDKEDDETDDYNEEYMKKHLKRYMKANKKACGATAKEVGLFEDEMKKAIDEIDTEAAGAVVEMADLTPVLVKIPEVMAEMAKAVEALSDQVFVVSEQNEKSFDILKKAGLVQVEMTKAVNDFLSVPMGRKGKIAGDGLEMKKAAEITISKENQTMIYQTLLKAVKTGDRQAGEIISAYESNGKNIARLHPAARQYIDELIRKEVH